MIAGEGLRGESKELPFEGKTFVTTGAASGIGRAITLEAARQGAYSFGIDIAIILLLLRNLVRIQESL